MIFVITFYGEKIYDFCDKKKLCFYDLYYEKFMKEIPYTCTILSVQFTYKVDTKVSNTILYFFRI